MTPEYKERYSRQIRLSGVGEEGQKKIALAHVAVVGCGALGSFQAGALARAGVGRITIVDRDYVEWSNLPRQWLFDESDAREALPKAEAARRHLARINGECRVEALVADLTACNVDEVIEGAQALLDGTDNFETRYLLNEYAVREGLPWVYGGAVGTYGISMPVLPGRTACFACLYPEPPAGVQPTCETAGVLNVLPSLVASLQVADALRILVGTEFEARLTTVDLWTGQMRQTALPERDSGCAVCGRRQFVRLEQRARTPISLCGRNAVQIHERNRPVDLRELGQSLDGVGAVRANEFALRVALPPYEMTVFADGRAIIKGTTDVAVARSLYSRYIGN